MRRAVNRMFLAALLSGSVFCASAAPIWIETAAASTPALTVVVSCYTNPERTYVHNNRSTPITIRTVGSLYKPYSSEPFYVTRKLGPGRSITFYTGNGASYSSANTLTRRYIYNNDVGTLEGARVVTSNGLKFVDRC